MMNLIIQGINWGIIGGVAVVVGTATLVITAKCYPPKGDRKIGGFFMCFCSVFILFSIYM